MIEYDYNDMCNSYIGKILQKEREFEWSLEQLKNGEYSAWINWAKESITHAVDRYGKKWFICKQCGVELGSYTNLEECYHDCRFYN